jgi:hypothetical protein
MVLKEINQRNIPNFDQRDLTKFYVETKTDALFTIIYVRSRSNWSELRFYYRAFQNPHPF